MMQALWLEYVKCVRPTGSAGVHRRTGRLASAVVCTARLLAACGKEQPTNVPLITPATLTAEQQTILISFRKWMTPQNIVIPRLKHSRAGSEPFDSAQDKLREGSAVPLSRRKKQILRASPSE